MSGETFDVGEDACAPVGPYEHGFPFTGTISKIEIELGSELDQQSQDAMQQGQADAAMRIQ